MTIINEFGLKFQLFQWDAELSVSDESQGSGGGPFGGMFMFYINAFRTSRFEKENVFLLVSQFHLQCLQNFETAGKLLAAALKQSRLLRSCENLENVASEIALDLYCKFSFGPEILSGEGNLKLSVCFDLDVLLGEESHQSFTNYVSNTSDEAKIVDVEDGDHKEEEEQFERKLDTFVNLGGTDSGEDELLNNLKRSCIGIGSKGGTLLEVMPKLEIVYFAEQDSILVHQTCSICLENTSEETWAVARTACSHTFHRECICEWLLRSDSCPMCRSSCIVQV